MYERERELVGFESVCMREREWVFEIVGMRESMD